MNVVFSKSSLPTVTGHDFVQAQAKRMGANLVMRGLVLLAVAAGFFALVSKEVLTQRTDALPTLAALESGPTHSLTRAGQRFTVAVDDYLDPSVSATGGTGASVRYRFIDVDGGERRYLMVASERPLKRGAVITGGLRAIDTKLIRQAVTIAAEVDPRLQGRVLSMYFDTGASASLGGLTVVFIVALCLAFIGVISALRGAHTRARPQRSAISGKLRQANATEAFAKHALVNGSGQPAMRDVAVTEEFVVLARVFSSSVFALEDLIWCHGVQNRARSDLRCYLRSGKKVGKSFGFTKASPIRRNLALAAIADAAPSAHVGFATQLAKRWKKQRAEMIAEVAERHK